ncbi:MAG: NUDIX domain-containing protein [Angelakisella sp.]
MAQEFWDIYDSNRIPTGRTEPRGPLVIGDYHLVVAVWMMNHEGHLLVTRRHPDRPWGNYWECTGGSAIAGESSVQAALREVREEVGLLLDPADGILLDSCREDRCFRDTWFFHADYDFNRLVLQHEEVAEARVITREQYDRMYRELLFVPTLRNFYKLYDVRIKAKL